LSDGDDLIARLQLLALLRRPAGHEAPHDGVGALWRQRGADAFEAVAHLDVEVVFAGGLEPDGVGIEGLAERAQPCLEQVA
jgi:hypothetical protein